MDFTSLCRLCVKVKLKLRNIVGDDRNTQLANQIRDILHLEFEENDGLPQKVCKACVTTVQKIQETMDEFRENDMRLRQHFLGIDEFEIKQEDFDETECDPVGYSIKEVKIEVLEPNFQPVQSDDLIDVEEWLDDGNTNSGETENDDQTDQPLRKRKRTKMKSEMYITTDKNSIPKEDTDEINLSPKQRSRRRAKGEPKPRRNRNKNADPNQPRLNDYKCYICKSESLGSAQNLLDHLSTHTDQLPHTCTMCIQDTVVIKQIRSLNMHMKMHEQPTKCEYCDRRYANGRARDYHIQAFHLGANAPCPSTCEVCGKVCASKLSLKTHMRRHTVAFNCEYCAKNFTEKSKLKRHVVRVHEKTAGYVCNFCQKRMNTIDAYELHVRTIHEGRRDHECDTCGRRFTTAAFLRMHHKSYPDGTCKPKNNWLPYYTTHTGEDGVKLFTCKVCNKEGMRSIGEHLRTHFPEEYECPVCLQKFPRKSSYDRHRLTHKEITHSCFSCEKCFISPVQLAKHMAKTHGIGQELDFGMATVSDEEIELEYDVVG